MDAFRRVRNSIALVAAAICAATAPLSSQADTGPLNGTPDDVRVAPLLTAHWNQGSVGNALCYNYYTPLNRVCGCTATSLSQIMYYHRYPTTRILPGETLYDDIDGYGKYSVGPDGNGGMTNTTTGAYTAFDPPYGGPYDWSSMVDSPTGSTPENSRKAIGLLTRDAGFAVFSHYFGGSTSGFTDAIASSIIINLHYADAVKTGFNTEKLIANLDAGLPVEVGITKHSVVADGYGYNNGKLYIHINYGYGGNKDGWYDPTTDLNGQNFENMVANIFPPTLGARHSSVISGRVLDASGNPVANATVTATGATNVTTTSSAKGIYAFILPAGTYTFTATSGGNSGTLANCAVAASEQKTRAEFADPYNQTGWRSGVNNSMSGVNVTLGKTVSMDEPDAYLEYVESDGRQWVNLSNLTQTRDIKFDVDVDWISGVALIGQGFYDQNPFTTINGEICCKWYMSDGDNGAHTGVTLPSGRHRFVVTGKNNAKLTVSVDGGASIESTATSSRRDMGEILGHSLYLFAQHSGGGSNVGGHSTAKLYGLKVYSADGELALDLVPAIKNGVAGLYDRMEYKWYPSQSGTALIAGPVCTPTSPTPTEFFSDQQTFVTLECATAGATIYYTTDGSDPTTSSTVYSAPFAVTSGTTVKARAYRAGLTESAIYSATFTFVAAAELTHRWSFTSDYSDSVGNSTGTPIGSALAIENGEVVMSGDGYGKGSLNLGNGIMPSEDATIEIWATRTGVKKWSRIFDIGSSTREYFTMSWVNDTDGSKEQVILRKNNVSDATANTMLYASDVKYHISVTFKANNDGSTTVSWARRNVETGALEKSGSKTYSGWTLATIAAGNFYLGHSQWSDNYDANAKYDEVRIWNGVVGDDQLAANAAMGPDVYTAGLENGFTLADNTVFNVPAGGYAASGIVTLGAGSKLRFDTSSIKWDPVSFSARGFTVPSGSILNYVEPADSSNFSVTFSNNTITVTRLRQNEPDAYIEYVESDGHQWVNLSNLTQTRDITFDADIDWISGVVFIGQSHYDQNPFTTINGEICCKWYMSDGDNGAHTGVRLPSGRHRFVVTGKNNAKLTVSVDGGASIESTATSSRTDMGTIMNNSKTLYLFAQHQGGGSAVGNYSSVKLYGLKVYGADGELVLDLVPGIKNGVAGLYDRVYDVWYVSQSGTALIAGPITERRNVPDAYLDYVKSTGAQWVSVGITPTQTMKFDVDVDWISGNALMAQSNYGLSPLTVNNGTIVSRWWMADAAASANTGVALDTGRRRFVITTSNAAYVSTSVDGGTPALSGGYSNRSGVNPSDLYIFAVHYGGTVGNAGEYSTAKLYGLKIYGANGALMRDYVPGIKNNVVGLYDRVCDKFFSSGSGTPLVAGPVVDRSKPDAFVEYVESNGSQWVDTGVDGRAGVKSEADIDWISGAPLGVINSEWGHCLLLQGLGDNKIGGQALFSQEAVTTVALNSGRHVVVSEACAGSKMTITVDGTTSAESPVNVYNYSTGLTIWMFAAHGGGGAWGAGNSKFYGLKLWRTGSDGVCRIQRHFIPCVKGGRAGLYDAVSGVIFYSHSGTDLVASSTTRTLSVWRNEADDASLDNAANWCGGLPNGTDAVVCAPWVPAVSATDGLAFANLTVSGGNLAFADGTNTVAGALAADGALAFTNLVINGSADCAVAISGFISGHGTVKSLTLAEGARFIPDGVGYLTVSDALDGTMLIDMTGIDLSGVTGRFPLFKTGTAEILPTADAVQFVGGRAPSGRLLLKVSSGFGYDLGSAGFFILLR